MLLLGFAGLVIGLVLGGLILLLPGSVMMPVAEGLTDGGYLQSGAPRVGQPAPQFTALSLAGETISEKDFIGKNTIINFWATWCVPCIVEMPILESAYDDHPSDLQIIGINAGESQQQITAFLDTHGITFEVAVDSDGSAQRNYQVLGLPMTFFIDQAGTIIAQHIGELSEKQLAGYLELLGVGVD